MNSKLRKSKWLWISVVGAAVLAVGLTVNFVVIGTGLRPVSDQEIATSDIVVANAMRDLGLLPIAIPRGQEVGSVFSIGDGRWVAESKMCFPGLKVRTGVPSVLRQIKIEQDVRLGLSVGLPKVVGGETSGTRKTALTITYPTVTVSTTSEAELRAAFSKDACPFLVDMFGAAVKGEAQFVVMSEVYYATRKVEFVVASKSDAKLQGDLYAKDNAVTVELSPLASGTVSVQLFNAEPMPVAARVAFIPVPRNQLLGGTAPSIDGKVWMPFDPEGDPSMLEDYSQITNRIVSRWEKIAAAK